MKTPETRVERRSLKVVALLRAAVLLALLTFWLVPSGATSRVAAAGASISLSRGLAAGGDSVTIKGSGFQPSDTVAIAISAVPQTVGRSVGSITTTATADASGSFSASFTVPNGTPAGTYTVVAHDGHANRATKRLEVLPVIQLKAGSSGPHVYVVAGQYVYVTGTGFARSQTVTLEASFPVYGGNAVTQTKNATTDSTGSISEVQLQVPWRAQNGDVSLTATEAQSGTNTTATIMVFHRPYLTFSSAHPGKVLVINGRGFVPGEQVTVSVTIARTSNAGTTVQRTVTAGDQGGFRTSIFVPRDAKQGGYTLKAVGSVAHLQASSRLTVSPGGTTSSGGSQGQATKLSLAVAPISVIPGSKVLVLGAGYSPNSSVTVSVSITVAGGSTKTVSAMAAANRQGKFRATLAIPADAQAGKYMVSGKDTNGHSMSARLAVAPLKPSVVVVPALAVPGTPVTVHGFGFPAGTTLTISLAGQQLGTVTTTPAGAFKTTVTVPGSLGAGIYTLTAQQNSGQKASIGLRLYRKIATHFYFASLYTGAGFQESLLFVNASEIPARVHITYQRTSGPPRSKSITIPAHSRVTHNVNNDLGPNVNAAAVIATDVPISAERMAIHGRDGTLDPGASSPSRIWYFANGNTSHQYQEDIAVQNPTNAWVRVTLQVQPTHSHTFYLHRTMHPQSRTTWNLNSVSHDAIGVIVTANGPVVANRTIFIHNGMSSKTGVKGPQTHWYFAAGPTQGNTRHWIGVINSTNQPSYLTLHAYSAQGAELATIKKWLKPYDRQGFLMNKYAGQTDVAVVVTTTKPSIAEQSTFVTGIHDAHTDSFGVTSPQKTAEFAEVTTWAHQDNQLALFNPNLSPIPVVVQFLNAHGTTTEQTYIIAPLSHQIVDVGHVVPNAQLGLLAASNDGFVAIDRQMINDGAGGMTSLGTQSSS
jgi:hypothetical protein